MSKQRHLHLGHSLFKAQKQYIRRKRRFKFGGEFCRLANGNISTGKEILYAEVTKLATTMKLYIKVLSLFVRNTRT